MMIYSESFIEVIDTEINRPVLIPIHDITFVAKNDNGKCTIHTVNWRVETAETYETVRSLLLGDEE